MLQHKERILLAQKSLLGVAVGDAFGDSFFGGFEKINTQIYNKEIPPTKWEFTDDTVMSIAIFEELERDGNIDQENLIKKFCRNHDIDPNRGYGATLRRVLREINEGQHWQEVSKNAFEGQGSMGNGASMRVCPIGAYHFDDIETVKILATKSAEITHNHPEAITGAIAIAVATAITTKLGIEHITLTPNDFIDAILSELPETDTKSKIAKAKDISYNYHIETIKSILGNGTNMTAQDTIPFVLWCVSHHLYHFENALWKAVSILGDRDTICAMVAGTTIMSSKPEYVPKHWFDAVENIEKSGFWHI